MRGLKKRKLDWAEIFEAFTADRALTSTPRTMDYYRETWRYWLKFNPELQEPDKALCQRFLERLAQTRNPNGVLAVWRGMKAIFNWAYREELSTFDPKVVKAPRDPKTQKQPLTDEEFRRLFDAAQNPRDRAMLMLLLDTGIRRQELRYLRPQDIDWELCQVFVWQGKGRRQRHVPFSPITMKLLRAWARVRESSSPWFFHNVDTNYGMQLTSDWVTLCIKRIAERAGLGNMGPHRLRHTFGRVNAASGMNAMMLQRLMGHSSVVVTQMYTNPTQEDLRQAHAAHSPATRVMLGKERA